MLLAFPVHQQLEQETEDQDDDHPQRQKTPQQREVAERRLAVQKSHQVGDKRFHPYGLRWTFSRTVPDRQGNPREGLIRSAAR